MGPLRCEPILKTSSDQRKSKSLSICCEKKRLDRITKPVQAKSKNQPVQPWAVHSSQHEIQQPQGDHTAQDNSRLYLLGQETHIQKLLLHYARHPATVTVNYINNSEVKFNKLLTETK